MTKVGFVKELQSGERIILPDAADGRLRFSSQAMLDRFPGAAEPASRSEKLLRTVVALRKQSKN